MGGLPDVPDGLFLAVDQPGNIFEGYCQNGALERPCLSATYVGRAFARFETEDGKRYEASFKNCEFFQGKELNEDGGHKKVHDHTQQREFSKEFDYGQFLVNLKEKAAEKEGSPEKGASTTGGPAAILTAEQ